MDLMPLMSSKLSRLTLSIAPLWSRGYVTLRFTPILSLSSSPCILQPSIKRPCSYSSVTRHYSTLQEDIEAQKTKIAQAQEYFDQYIEEYYEVDDVEEETVVKPEKIEEELCAESVDDVVNLLRRERAKDIVVLELGADGPGTVDTMITCSYFNVRHGNAVAEILRKAGKVTDEQPKKCTVRNSAGWFQIELGKIQVHVMSEDIRLRFNLEALWGLDEVPEEEEDFLSIPPLKTEMTC
ncbi:hypothetical protein KIN20_014477 [Parelaphostrongylus tenuis]|uniref:Uncharacterized protein n=1 Tax=Parelaphostrongylus tenuis TaxID=148309 RepID=A0AAD5MDQ3_PARTN|nr:hypothetical protein KIN20_014477 [Parelaphostrongylus tenuis]